MAQYFSDKRFSTLRTTMALILVPTVLLLTSCGDAKANISPQDTTASNQGLQSQAQAEALDKIESYAIVNEAVVFNDAAIAVLNHPDARKAIALAIDKEALVERILKSTGRATDYLVPRGLVQFSNDQDFRSAYPSGWYRYNKEAALASWNKALEDLDVKYVTLHLLIMSSSQARSVGRHLKAQLESALPGLTLKINSYDFAQKVNMANKGRFGLEYYGWGPDYPDPVTYLDLFMTDNPHNTSKFSDPYYDGLLEAAKQGATPETSDARLKSLQEAERYLIADQGLVIPLYQTGNAFLTKPYVKDIINQSFGGRFFYKYADTNFTQEGLKVLRTMTQSEIQSLDSSLAQDTVSFEVLSNVMEGLVSIDSEGNPMPAVAKSWETSEDGKTYRFHLRTDAKWSNGNRVTANDFVFAWQRLASPATASPYSFMVETAQIKGYKAVLSGDAPASDLGVIALDDHTLEVQLENPVPYFLKLMSFASFYPISKDFLAYKGASYGQGAENTIYNGPFTLSQWDPGYGYVFSRNGHYWDRASVLLHTITFRQYSSDDRALQDYEQGRIDRLQLNVDQADTLKDHAEFTLSQEPTVFYLTFNVGNYE